MPFSITASEAEYRQYSGPKINYSNSIVDEAGIRIVPQGLLFETNIRQQAINCFEYNQHTAFFKTQDEGWPFDIFSATFYLLSRYEEYLPHTKDDYGRYAHTNALAYKAGFLQQPLINIWVQQFGHYIWQQHPALQLQPSVFRFLPTYDIDMAWSYRHKGLLRNIAGFIANPSVERLAVLSRKKADPFDSFQWLDTLHRQYNLQPVYFFLVAQRNSRYDKNILPHRKAMQQLLQHHASQYTIGIHPGWQSGDDDRLLQQEIAVLKKATGQPVSLSRQHYIRFNLPQGYRRLLAAGITDDYSMGYGSINGFRASVAAPFYWYDLEREEQTVLRVHPFCFMDANSYYEQQYSPVQAFDEMLHYYEVCKNNYGTLITLWHNNFTGTAKAFAGWREVYEQFIARIL